MKIKEGYDFSGWATKNDLKCSDGRIIRRNAFKVNDGMTVPLVWGHRHDTPSAVLGHALLVNKDDGVFTYGYFNNSEEAKRAKEAVRHEDVVSLSIFANNLVQDGPNVLHGAIKEVSLVLAGANPGAFIESVIQHGYPLDETEDEALLFTGENLVLSHSEDDYEDEDDEEDENDEDDTEDDDYEEDNEMAHSEGGRSIRDVFDSMSDEQKQAVYAIVSEISGDDSEVEHSDIDDEEDLTMKHNVFEGENYSRGNVLSHDDMQTIFNDAKRCGSLKDAVENAMENGVLAHAVDGTGMTEATGEWRSIIPEGRPTQYGFNDPDMLFPEYRSLNTPPEWISRNMDWVSVLMNGVHHTPFSRIKSQYANITEDEARARGYIKAHQKKEEIFTLLKRTTDPQTIYKKQRMDRDDIIDITDFDVVAWIKGEMRVMLNEEIARAILIGDGRAADSEDKIQEQHIRPIINDVPLFNTKVPVKVDNGADDSVIAKTAIDSIILSRKNYKGSGSPIFFTTEDWLAKMLLIEDGIGHKLYKSESELATTLRVSRIVTVELLENQTVPVETSSGGSTTTTNKPLMGVIVNPADYNVGADKGGSIELFDDFDIDFNQYVYLIETRISGALIKPYSALTVYVDEKAKAAG